MRDGGSGTDGLHWPVACRADDAQDGVRADDGIASSAHHSDHTVVRTSITSEPFIDVKGMEFTTQGCGKTEGGNIAPLELRDGGARKPAVDEQTACDMIPQNEAAPGRTGALDDERNCCSRNRATHGASPIHSHVETPSGIRLA